MRDKKGKFLPGHKILAPRDKVTGRVISFAEFKQRKAVSEVSVFLDSRLAS